jgi:hypothetical protein
MFLFAAAPVAAWVIAPAYAEPVAMVTDLSGKVVAPGAKSRITILAEIEAETRVQLDPGARLVAIYLKSGDEYTITGPATVNFRPEEPVATSGAKPAKRGNPLAQGGAAIRIKPVGVIQAALVMRSVRPAARIRLLSLSGTHTLEAQPEFRWQELQPGIKYQFEISDDTGRTLHEAQIDATSLRLPSSVQLKAGVPYTWEVSTRLADGRKYSSAGDFSVAPAELRAQAEALRPAASAPLSTRIAYAAWLEQMGLKDEARKYWKAAWSERPEDPRLKALAEQ